MFKAGDPEAEMYWLQMSDFYDWPYTQLFDSFQDLKEKLAKADFNEIHQNMKSENKIRGLQLNLRWCSVIDRMKNYKLRQRKSSIASVNDVTTIS